MERPIRYDVRPEITEWIVKSKDYSTGYNQAISDMEKWIVRKLKEIIKELKKKE